MIEPLGTTVTVFAGNSPLTATRFPKRRGARPGTSSGRPPVENKLADRPGNGLVEPVSTRAAALVEAPERSLKARSDAEGLDPGREIGREEEQALYSAGSWPVTVTAMPGSRSCRRNSSPSALVAVDDGQLGHGRGAVAGFIKEPEEDDEQDRKASVKRKRPCR